MSQYPRKATSPYCLEGGLDFVKGTGKWHHQPHPRCQYGERKLTSKNKTHSQHWYCCTIVLFLCWANWQSDGWEVGIHEQLRNLPLVLWSWKNLTFSWVLFSSSSWVCVKKNSWKTQVKNSKLLIVRSVAIFKMALFQSKYISLVNGIVSLIGPLPLHTRQLQILFIQWFT